MPSESTLYADVLATGGYISNHESDLYIEVNEQNREILQRYPNSKLTAQTFVNQVTGKLCWDVPFAYLPWWEARATKAYTNLGQAPFIVPDRQA